MTDFLTPLISQIKNPWQYLFVGCTWFYVIYNKINDKYLFSVFFISMGAAWIWKSIIDWILDKIKQHKLKKELEFSLMNLNSYERDILKELFKKHNQSCDLDINSPGVWSLNSKNIIRISKIDSISKNDIVSITVSKDVWKMIQKNAHEILDVIRISI